jgi:hypothetical protein
MKTDDEVNTINRSRSCSEQARTKDQSKNQLVRQKALPRPDQRKQHQLALSNHSKKGTSREGTYSFPFFNQIRYKEDPASCSQLDQTEHQLPFHLQGKENPDSFSTTRTGEEHPYSFSTRSG